MDGVEAKPGAGTTVCVTGATGYIGSWLVRSLLRRGYVVHGTARDTEDEVRSKILEPAVRGTINLLQACWRAGSVKRVIFTSSISTITAKDARGEWKSVVDESSVTPIDVVWTSKPSGWVYVLSKLLTEEKAFQFAKEKGMDLVSIVPPTVAGPFLKPSVPASVQVLLSPITGDPKLYPILTAVHSRLGSISLVHIEDICNAHIFLMDQPTAEGRYICAAGSCVMSRLVDLLSFESPSSSAGRVTEEFHDSIPSVICSNRLTDLGFKFQYGIRDIINQSVACCNERSFLKNQVVNDDLV